jgi:DNA topoisomerase IA
LTAAPLPPRLRNSRINPKPTARQLPASGQLARIVKVERKEKSEKAPLPYDLTTLQRDANRLLGYTAQQTLDYLQSLYEKKICTYPRTDSRCLTDDMEAQVPAFVKVAACHLRRQRAGSRQRRADLQQQKGQRPSRGYPDHERRESRRLRPPRG